MVGIAVLGSSMPMLVMRVRQVMRQLLARLEVPGPADLGLHHIPECSSDWEVIWLGKITRLPSASVSQAKAISGLLESLERAG